MNFTLPIASNVLSPNSNLIIVSTISDNSSINWTSTGRLTQCTDCQKEGQDSLQTWTCPLCSFDALPSSVARMIGGRCSRNCFECPYCSSNCQVDVNQWMCALCGWNQNVPEGLKSPLGMAIGKLEHEDALGKVYDQIRTHLHSVLYPADNPLLDKTKVSMRANRVQLLIKKARLTASLKNSSGVMHENVRERSFEHIEAILEKLTLEKSSKSDEWPNSRVLDRQEWINLGQMERNVANVSFEECLPLTTRLNNSAIPSESTRTDLKMMPNRTKLRAKIRRVCCGKPVERILVPNISYNEAICVSNPTNEPMAIVLEWEDQVSKPITLDSDKLPSTTFGPWTLQLKNNQLKLSSVSPVKEWSIQCNGIRVCCKLIDPASTF
jgi:hypothetical protein